MNAKILVFTVASFGVFETSLAQISVNDSLLTHYPLQVGNIWDYNGGYYFLGSFLYPNWTFVAATKDSIHSNGKKYTVLERISYDMDGSDGAGSLGQIRKEIHLQRVDSTSLNVYQIHPWAQPISGNEFLVDSLKAMKGDSIITNSGTHDNILLLYDVAIAEFLGKHRITRMLAVVNALVGFQFATAEGLGEISRSSGGEGSPSFSSLRAAIIQSDTIGVLLRNQPSELTSSKENLIFSNEIKIQRIFFANRGHGLTIIDSVKMGNEANFYSHPRYHGAGYLNTFFSKGYFLVFPQDSISLDIFIRETALNEAFDDTLWVYARGSDGKMLPRFKIPVSYDPTVSVENSYSQYANIPQSHNLSVYPNPTYSESKVTISYQLFQTAYSKIQVFDVAGRIIAILAGQKMNPGKHQSFWEISGIPSGVYFICLTTHGKTETTRFHLIK
jgi:hypothetical protein